MSVRRNYDYDVIAFQASTERSQKQKQKEEIKKKCW